jgi:hypothetical protein
MSGSFPANAVSMIRGSDESLCFLLTSGCKWLCWP